MAVDVWDHFGNNISRDLLDMCIGRKLGTGMSRDVYEFGPDPSVVIKFETNTGSFQNIVEWEAWHSIKKTKIAKWFCPILRISDNGKVMLMKKTEPMGWNERPAKMPKFFTDLKIQNFGWLDGQLVAHDYGINFLIEKGTGGRLVKADWWKAE